MLKEWKPNPMRRDSSGGPASKPLGGQAPGLPPSARPPASPPAPASPARAPIPARRSTSFGSVPWTGTDILAGLEEFASVYARKPVADMDGSMVSVGLLGFWHVLRAVQPALVVECGVNRGLTTWIIEQALPSAQVVCVDKDFARLAYRSAKAQYVEADFLDLGLDPEGETALAVFDDHGDAPPRVRHCLQSGILHLLFDDNYPELSGSRHLSLAACLGARSGPDRDLLLEQAEAYYVFPPVFDHDDPVTQERSLILEPSLMGAFDASRDADYGVFHRERAGYRWPTYLRLKGAPRPA